MRSSIIDSSLEIRHRRHRPRLFIDPGPDIDVFASFEKKAFTHGYYHPVYPGFQDSNHANPINFSFPKDVQFRDAPCKLLISVVGEPGNVHCRRRIAFGTEISRS